MTDQPDMTGGTDITALPDIAIVVPCLNEAKYIGGCLDSVLTSSYPPDRIEIVVMDGMSGDGTRDIVDDYAARYPMIRMIDNPGANKSRALNEGIAQTKGEIVFRLDAHALYDEHYFELCVRYLQDWNADNVGGIRKTLPGSDTIIGKAIAYSINNRFAAGDASYRTGVSGPTWTDIVFLFCCRRSFLKKMGPFREELVRGQDREFNIRVQEANGKALLVPEIVSRYYARHEIRTYRKWMFDSGAVPLLISRITGRRLYSLRNLVPAAFVSGNAVLAAGGIVWSPFWALQAIMLSLYTVLALGFSVGLVKQERNPLYLVVMPVIFLLTHCAYGLGTLQSLFTRVPPTTDQGETGGRNGAATVQGRKLT